MNDEKDLCSDTAWEEAKKWGDENIPQPLRDRVTIVPDECSPDLSVLDELLKEFLKENKNPSS